MSMRENGRVRTGLLLACFALLLAAPEFVTVGTMRTLMLTAVLGLVACGLNFVLGYAGQLALGHVFFYGAAAYSTAIFAVRGTTSLLVLLAVGVAIAIAAALITGIPGLRLSNWTLGLVSFFLIAIFPDLVNIDPDLTGGPTGIVAVPPLELGGTLDSIALFRVAVVLLATWLLVQRNMVYSAYGRIFSALRKDEIQVASLGVSSYRLKLFAYVLSAIPAGFAGVAFATLDGFVTPNSFTLHTSILVLAAVVIGGQRTLYGPLLGTFLLVEAQQRLLSLQEYTLLVFGVFLVVAAVLLPDGIVGTIAGRVGGWRRPLLDVPTSDAEGDVALGPLAPADLAATGLSKRFGGVQALDDVDLIARAGQITALIGPNGSGKTTLLNAVSGFVRVDAGTIALGDRRIERLSPASVAAAGVGRTFQTPSLPDDLSVREAVSVAAFATRRSGLVSTVLRLPRWTRDELRIARRVDEVLRELDIADDAQQLASALPLGKKRLVEIARAVMMQPPLLVLDEAASGLDPHERERLGHLLRRLAGEGTAVLLVEHNMDLVLRNADRVVVLASGSVLAEGAPAEVANDERVVTVYLGRGAVPAEVGL